MFDYHEKRKIRAWLYSNLSIGVLLILIVFMGMSVLERYEKERETAEKRSERAAELKEIETRASALETKVEAAESARGIEAEIRNRYDVAKEGEEVVVIIDEENNEEESTTKSQDQTGSTGRSFFDMFKFW